MHSFSSQPAGGRVSVYVSLTAAGRLPECQCYTVGNKRKSKQTCVVAYMSCRQHVVSDTEEEEPQQPLTRPKGHFIH